MKPTHYRITQEEFESAFASEVERFRLAAEVLIDGQMRNGAEKEAMEAVNNTFDSYANMATFIKHRAFREEAEVRIVVSPANEYWTNKERENNPNYQAARGPKSFKEMKKLNERRFVSLFDEEERLPIKRVIVGPSRKQADNFALVSKLCGSRVEVTKSETPFIEI